MRDVEVFRGNHRHVRGRLFMEDSERLRTIPWRRNLAFTTFGVIVAGSAFSLVTPFLPLFLAELGVAENLPRWSGLVLAAQAFTYTIMAPIWGVLADRYGKRVMILRSGLGIALTYLLMGIARSRWDLLLYRVLNGFLGGFIPSCLMLVATNTPAPHLAWALGIVQTASSVGNILGPLVGGFAAGALGVRSAFFFGAGLLLLATAATHLGTREAVGGRSESGSVLGGFRETLRRRDLLALFLLMFAVQTALAVIQPTLPLFVKEMADGLNPRRVAIAAGMVFSLTGLSTALGAPLVGRLRCLNPRKALWAGVIAAGVISGCQGLAQNLFLLGFERFLAGFAYAVVLVVGNVAIARSAPEAQRGQVFGVLNAVSSLGTIIGPMLGGLIADSFGVRSSFFLSGALFLAALPLLSPGERRRTLTSPGPNGTAAPAGEDHEPANHAK